MFLRPSSYSDSFYQHLVKIIHLIPFANLFLKENQILWNASLIQKVKNTLFFILFYHVPSFSENCNKFDNFKK